MQGRQDAQQPILALQQPAVEDPLTQPDSEITEHPGTAEDQHHREEALDQCTTQTERPASGALGGGLQTAAQQVTGDQHSADGQPLPGCGRVKHSGGRLWVEDRGRFERAVHEELIRSLVDPVEDRVDTDEGQQRETDDLEQRLVSSNGSGPCGQRLPQSGGLPGYPDGDDDRGQLGDQSATEDRHRQPGVGLLNRSGQRECHPVDQPSADPCDQDLGQHLPPDPQGLAGQVCELAPPCTRERHWRSV